MNNILPHIKDRFSILRLEEKVSDFDEWEPKAYLKDYYSKVEQDERATIKFLVHEFKKIKNNPVAIEFGIGPTLHHLIPLAPHVSEIHVADYLKSNLDEIMKWKYKERNFHNWNEFTRLTLQYEGIKTPTQKEIDERENLVRKRITKFLFCDASLSNPLRRSTRAYDFVLSCYCADSATILNDVWNLFMKNTISLLTPGGFFVTSALRNCTYYKVGNKLFPCANINEKDFQKIFKEPDFDITRVVIKVENVPEHKNVGYESIVLASGFKKI